jgi:hypothetical protein
VWFNVLTLPRIVVHLISRSMNMNFIQLVSGRAVHISKYDFPVW